MSESLFFDTNILFYAFDSSEPDKQSIAQELLSHAISSDLGWTSVQVFGEFFQSTVIRKQLMSAAEADQAISSLSALNVMEVDRPMVRAAITIHQHYQTSYWDSLVLASAQRSKASFLITEDLNHGQTYEGVEARNPFL